MLQAIPIMIDIETTNTRILAMVIVRDLEAVGLKKGQPMPDVLTYNDRMWIFTRGVYAAEMVITHWIYRPVRSCPQNHDELHIQNT